MTAFKHGKYYTRIYRIYNDMKKRCYNHSMINKHCTFTTIWCIIITGGKTI